MKLFKYLILCLIFGNLQSQILINEIYLLDKTQKTNQEFFIEFYNLGSEKASLSGHKVCVFDKNNKELSCGEIKATKEKSYEIYPKSFNYTKINRTQRADYFLYTQLAQTEGKVLKLFDRNNILVDEVEIGYMTNGKSFCRFPDGVNNWANAFITKNHRNRPHLNLPHSYFSDKVHEKEILEAKKDSSKSYLKDKIKINEVFFINTHDEILRKDFWIELVNISDETLDITNLSLSMDTLKQNRKLISDSIFMNLNKSVMSPNETWMIKLTHHLALALDETAVELEHTSSTLFVFDDNVLLDSVSLPVLDRDESYARIPNGNGEFKIVKYETPGFSNDQVMPGIYAKPSTQIMHTVGFGISNYNIKSFNYNSVPRLCSTLGFAFQHNLGFFEMRHSLNYKKQSFGIRYDTTLVTDFGRISSSTKGTQRMEYLGFSSEIGMPISQRFELFYGIDMDIMLNKTSNYITTIRSETNTGIVSQTQTPSDEYIISTDNLDLNLSMAVEYKIMDNLKLNLSARRDFGGVNLSANNGHAKNIKTTVFQFKLIIPFYISDKLEHKAYLFTQKINR